MTITLNALQKQRRDTASNWTSNNTVLLAGEWGIESDTKKFKIGDGTTAWQSLDYVPIPDTNRLLTGDLTVGGNFTVNGTTTTIDTTTLTVEDKNIEIGKVSSPSDTTADGGGITLKGATDKTINWVDSTDSWTFSEHLDLASGKVLKSAGTQFLSPTQYTGNSATATALATARTIAGTSFDGSGNIDISYANLTNKLSVGDGGLTQNNFTDALLSKLNGIATSATNVTNNNQLTNGAGYITATLTNEQVQDIVGSMVSGNTETGITVTYQDSDGTIDFVVASQTDENFTTTLKNKLDGIEAGADVTDATNVNSAGAVMNSDTSTASMNFVVDEDNFSSNSATKVPTQQSVKAYVDANAGGGISNLVEDTSPQLGGDLDTNSFEINLDDNHAVNFGNSSDLEILHSGSTGVINNITGDLHIKTTGSGDDIVLISNDDIELQVAGGEAGIKVIGDGEVELYQNDTLKLRTGVSGNFGSVQTQNGAGSYAGYSIQGNYVFMASATETGIYNDIDNEWMIYCIRNGKVELRYDGNAKLVTSGSGVTVTGALTATGDVTAFSDETLKKDITTIENAIDICSKLRGVSYKWIKDDKASIGVIAQEVEKVIPEVVHTTEHEGAEVKSVDYGKIIGVLINAINEQQAKWDEWMELLKEIRKMENKLIEVIGNY